MSTGLMVTRLQSNYADWLTWPDVFKVVLRTVMSLKLYLRLYRPKKKLLESLIGRRQWSSGQGSKALIDSANSSI
jgi:hypothetical protein